MGYKLIKELSSTIDGDTVRAGYIIDRSPCGTELIKRTSIRIGFIDAPEQRYLSTRRFGEYSKYALEWFLKNMADEVLLYTDIKPKYAGRLIGDLQTKDGTLASQWMLDMGMAKPYAGGKRSWSAEELFRVSESYDKLVLTLS